MTNENNQCIISYQNICHRIKGIVFSELTWMVGQIQFNLSGNINKSIKGVIAIMWHTPPTWASPKPVCPIVPNCVLFPYSLFPDRSAMCFSVVLLSFPPLGSRLRLVVYRCWLAAESVTNPSPASLSDFLIQWHLTCSLPQLFNTDGFRPPDTNVSY